MNRDDEAEAVMASLSQTIQCDCGLVHSYGSGRRTYPRNDVCVECACGRAHNATVYCPCGTTHEFGVKAGWRVVKRKHQRWKAIEKMLRDRIAQLEGALLVH